jgi:Transglutaminase-like superfamily
MFPKPIAPGKKYVYEMQMLLNPKFIIQKLGNLNIVEWPKQDLTDIIFLKNSGKLFFSSALAQFVVNPKNNSKRIIPGAFAKKLISHANRSSAIRFEWGRAPIFTLTFNYKITNTGSDPAKNIEISTYCPPTTKFQDSKIHLCKDSYLGSDEDENKIVKLKIDSLARQSSVKKSFSVTIVPQGNKNILLPNFGDWKQYQGVTKPGSYGYDMLKASKYWPISDPGIKKLVKILKKNAEDVSEYIKLAFEFVNQKIKYNINGFRDDASNTLKSREGDCSEFSDLFVCVLRAAGIPAKIVHGWTIDLDTHALGPHAWVEFFSSKMGWMQCDPTWAFLTGVSCQHICRQREGLIRDQCTFSWKFNGNTNVDIEEKLELQIL